MANKFKNIQSDESNNVTLENKLTVSTDVRTPIFYDSNDTNYYVNPDGSSNLLTTTVNNRWVGNAIYFGGGNNYLNWTNSRIYSNVGIESNDSMRTPIFYDSNDTTYFTDPASRSLLNNLDANHFGINNSSSTTKDGISLYGGYAAGEPTYGIMFTGTSGSGIYGSVTSDWATYFTMNNNDARGWIFRKAGVGNTSSISAGGVATFGSSTQSPIFYDNVDTAYYLDPASTGTSLKTAGGIITTAASGSILLEHQVSEANAWLFQENAGNWGTFWFNTGTESGQTFGSYTTVGAEFVGFRHNTATNSINPSAWTGIDVNANATWLLSNYSGYIWSAGTQYSATDMRAPIFYDSAATAYYVDPGSISILSQASIGTTSNPPSSSYALNLGGNVDLNDNDINYVSQLHFNDNLRFFDNGDDSYLTYKYGDTNAGGIRFRNGSDAQKGYVYADNSGFGLLDNDGAWAVRTQLGTDPLQLYCDGNNEFEVHTTYTYSPGSSRAPYFYDSDSTTYYVNPADRSYLAEVFIPPVTSATSGATIRTYAWSDPNWGFSTLANTPNFHVRVHGYGSSHGTDRQFQVVNAASSNAVQLAVNFDGSGTAIGAAGTESGYKLTVHGAVHMKNDDINYVRQLHFNDNVRFYDDGNDNYLNFKWGDAANGGIIFRDGDNVIQGYVYGSGNGDFGLLDKDGSWTLITDGATYTGLRSNNNPELFVYNDRVEITADLRSPIYYDKDDTNYYADINSSSVFRDLELRTYGLRMIRSYSHNGIWFNGGTDDNHVLWNDYYGGPNARGAANSGFDGIKWNTYRGIHIKGGTDGAYNIIVAQNASSNSNNHTVELYAYNVKQFETESGYALATNQMRAPIFYDSNNTGYYLDPASTTRLNSLDIWSGGIQYWYRSGGNAHQRADARLDGSDQARLHWYGKDDAGITRNFKHAWYDGASYVNVTAASDFIYFDRVSGTVSVQADGSFRAPIFYDSNDTNYYVDPGNTNLSVKVYGEISNSNYAVGNLQPGSLNIGRTDTNYAGITTWNSDVKFGIMANCLNDWEFGIHDSGASVESVFLYQNTNGLITMGRDVGWGTTPIVAASQLRAPAFYDSDSTSYNLTPDSAATGQWQVNTPSGYVRIGPGNSSYSHFYTDRGKFYFNKALTVDTGVVQSYNEDLLLRRLESNTDYIQIRDTSIGFFLDTAEDMRLENDGDLHVEGDVIAYSTTISDNRLKDDVVTIDTALDKVSKLRGVEYTWNATSRKGQKDIGVIAQEVEGVIPEIVREKKMSLVDGEKYKTVDYEKLTAVLIEAVKELKAEVEELKNKCNDCTK